MENNYCSFTPKLSNYYDYTNEGAVENIFTSLFSLLNTPSGSHCYDPDFGVNIKSIIFQHDSGQLTRIIEETIKASLRRYLPEVYPLVAVVCQRELHPSGFGFRYKVNIVIENVIVTFGISKEGELMFQGILG